MGGRAKAHGDPFPLPLGLDHSAFEKRAGVPRYLAQRLRRAHGRERRVQEAAAALNGLASPDAGSSALPSPPASGRMSESERSALSRIGRRVASFGDRPADLTPKEALFALLRTNDLYSDEAHLREPFDESRLRVLRGDFKPLPLIDRLDGEARRLRDGFRHSMERTEAELTDLLEQGDAPVIRPYWCPRLRDSRDTRVSFFKRLHAIGLGTFRKGIRAEAGMFFVRKKDGGQRLIIDARVANFQHKRPPRAELSSAGCLSQLNLRVAPGSDAEAAPLGPAGGPEAEPPELFGSSVDLVDSFYQFVDDDLCTWFGCPWPEKASTWGVDTVFDEDAGAEVPADPGEELFFCFRGMPMGWSWALYYCQEAMAAAVRRAVPETSPGVGGLLVDGRPAPLLRRGSPVAAVYVDNSLVVATSREECDAAMGRVLQELRRVGLAFHALESSARVLEFVGLEIDLERRVLRNTRKRAWRLYLALEQLIVMGGANSRVMEVVNGHLVHFFSLSRAALSAMRHVYGFVDRTESGWRRFDEQTLAELNLIKGLVFVSAEVSLDQPPCAVALVGDASLQGYSLLLTDVTAEEVEEVARYREKWRFREEEVTGRRAEEQPRRAALVRPNLGLHRELLGRFSVEASRAAGPPARQLR